MLTRDELYHMSEHELHSAFAFIGSKVIKNLEEMLEPRPTHKWYEYGRAINSLQSQGFNFKHIVTIANLER